MEISEKRISEFFRLRPQEAYILRFQQKHLVSWYPKSADFEVPNQMQPEEYSTGGGKEDSGYESSCVVNVNWNADDRKWNVNTWDRDDNRWNAGNRVLSPETPEFLPRRSIESREFLLLVLCAIPR